MATGAWRDKSAVWLIAARRYTIARDASLIGVALDPLPFT